MLNRTYFVVASRMVRPGIVYRVSVLVLQAPLPLTVRVAIQRNGVEISGESQDVKEGILETIILRVSVVMWDCLSNHEGVMM
jgi:hypothetical protein